jgi:hypothetical protein
MQTVKTGNLCTNLCTLLRDSSCRLMAQCFRRRRRRRRKAIDFRHAHHVLNVLYNLVACCDFHIKDRCVLRSIFDQLRNALSNLLQNLFVSSCLRPEQLKGMYLLQLLYRRLRLPRRGRRWRSVHLLSVHFCSCQRNKIASAPNATDR